MRNSILFTRFFCSLCFYLNAIWASSFCCECRQNSKDLASLLCDAKYTQVRLIDFLNKLSLKYDKSVVSDPGIKQMKTIKQLLQTRWNGDASMITDYARATICVQNIRDVYMCLEDIKALPLTIVSIVDHFFEPTKEMYRDINIVFKDSENGHLGEIQINTKDILEYKNFCGHKLFDEMRNLRASACCQGRILMPAENKRIEQLISQSAVGYNAAYVKSLIIGDKNLRVGVYGILTKGNQVFMVKTQSGNRAIYNFPGGGVEESEGFCYALKRECKEEINKEVAIGELFYVSKNLYMHEDFTANYMFNLYYVISLPDNDYEIASGKWFELHDLPIDQMLPLDLEFINYLINKVKAKE